MKTVFVTCVQIKTGESKRQRDGPGDRGRRGITQQG